MASLSAGGPAPKKQKRALLDDSDSDSDDGGASSGLKVNEEFARRFEHNKKREEQQKLEEKFKRNGQDPNADGSDQDEDSSSDETEDDDGFLATEDLDAQISATLQALKNKDPRVYDKNVTFYNTEDGEEEGAASKSKTKKEAAVFLKDYHRQNFLRGDAGASDNEEDAPKSYVQEQDALKKSIVNEINAVYDDNDEDQDSDDDEDGGAFMQKKEKQAEKLDANGVHPSRAHQTTKITNTDVESADRDPETYLSNFLSSRAWTSGTGDGPGWKPFESDDDNDDDRADEFEQAYNMRFEDPTKSNEVLRSYARDIANARSVRRDEKTGRKRQRELEKEQKAAEKIARGEEKARLRKLKLEETEGRLAKIKQAAGAVGKELSDEDWLMFLDDAWENDKWEEEMQKRFGDDYYATKDANFKNEDDDEDDEEVEGTGGKKKLKKLKKPKWDNDIDINDIVPDFEDEDAKPDIALTDEEEGEGEAEEDSAAENEVAEDGPSSSKRRKTKDHKKERRAAQKLARQERSKLEALVDSKLQLTSHDLLLPSSSTSAAGATSSIGPFRYRETSPQTFGMTARDILLAPSDQALNDYAGLKKLATFRDEEKKRRDRKTFGKKARLRQWRRETFGPEFERTGPTYGFERVLGEEAEREGAGASKGWERRRKGEEKEGGEEGGDNVVGGVGERKKKRKRSKSKKASLGGGDE